MAYEIVTAETIEFLVEKVNLLLSQGWITQGGAIYNPNDHIYMQTMISTIDYENLEDDDAEDHDDANVVITPDAHVSLDGSEYVPKEWEPAFWAIVSKEFSKDALLLIARKHVLSISELLEKMTYKHFRTEAGEEVLEEIQNFIKKYNWNK